MLFRRDLGPRGSRQPSRTLTRLYVHSNPVHKEGGPERDMRDEYNIGAKKTMMMTMTTKIKGMKMMETRVRTMMIIMKIMAMTVMTMAILLLAKITTDDISNDIP